MTVLGATVRGAGPPDPEGADPDGPAVLIAAQSGRALAAAARRAGLRPLVLDLFGDTDTRALAERWVRLPGGFGTGARDGAEVLERLGRLAGRAGGRVLGVVLGSGFEAAPDLIRAIGDRHRLLGAGGASVAALKHPARFADLCTRLAIPHPVVALDAVPDPADWLVKRVGGSGGGHVRPAPPGAPPPGHYLQLRVPGRAFALNGLAHRDGFAALALTDQWSAPGRLSPCRFGGALAPGPREPVPAPLGAVRAAVERAVADLVRATGLRGLMSADLLVDGADWWLLEINPRPGATLDILDRRSTPLLAAHMEACLGGAPRIGDPSPDAAGTEICYAPRHLRVPSIDWPDYVRDRPRPGSRVARDAPVCTVGATGPDAGRVREMLRERVGRIGAALAGG